MVNASLFWQHFNKKEFEQAQFLFDQLDSELKQEIFSKLFQQSQNQNKPHSVSVLFRELHPEKQFDDFYQAWLPAKDKCNPIQEGGQTYQQFFPIPIRVINAVNMQDPSKIISIGLHWMTDEEFTYAMGNKKASQDGVERGDNISEVADKTHSAIYKVVKDDNLGSSF